MMMTATPASVALQARVSLVQAIRALEAQKDCLPPFSQRAQTILAELDQLRDMLARRQ